jgi:hypothetical protein
MDTKNIVEVVFRKLVFVLQWLKKRRRNLVIFTCAVILAVTLFCLFVRFVLPTLIVLGILIYIFKENVFFQQSSPLIPQDAYVQGAKMIYEVFVELRDFLPVAPSRPEDVMDGFGQIHLDSAKRFCLSYRLRKRSSQNLEKEECNDVKIMLNDILERSNFPVRIRKIIDTRQFLKVEAIWITKQQDLDAVFLEEFTNETSGPPKDGMF